MYAPESKYVEWAAVLDAARGEDTRFVS